MNELSSASRSGPLTVAGTATEKRYPDYYPGVTGVTVNGETADVYGDGTFAATNFTPTDGWNSYTAVAQDNLGRRSTNTVSVYLANPNCQYDANGNLTNDGTRNFAYDDENELIAVWETGAWSNSFAYDGKMRRRITKEYNWQSATGNWQLTNEVHYIYDGNVVIQERDGNNTPLVTYTRGNDLSGSLQGAGGIGGLLARTHNGQEFLGSSLTNSFYHCDGNGNVTCLIYQNQQIAAKYLYDPYGNTLAMSGPLANANKYRFSSKEWDKAGLYYYLYRFYDSNLQRWPNRDPLWEPGFESCRDTIPSQVRQFMPASEEIKGPNLYRFVANNPVNFFDPFGLADSIITYPSTHPYGYVDPFGNWHPTFCLSCHDNTPAGNFYRDQAMLANNQSWGVFAYQQGLGLSLGLFGGGLADDMMLAQEMNSVRQLGRAGECYAGITGPKTRIPSLTGTAAYRIPDELTADTLREIKNVANLNRVTGQLQDFTLFSQQSQRQFTLEIRQNTVIAPSVDQYLQLNQVNIIRSLPPQ